MSPDPGDAPKDQPQKGKWSMSFDELCDQIAQPENWQLVDPNDPHLIDIESGKRSKRALDVLPEPNMRPIDDGKKNEKF